MWPSSGARAGWGGWRRRARAQSPHCPCSPSLAVCRAAETSLPLSPSLPPNPQHARTLVARSLVVRPHTLPFAEGFAPPPRSPLTRLSLSLSLSLPRPSPHDLPVCPAISPAPSFSTSSFSLLASFLLLISRLLRPLPDPDPSRPASSTHALRSAPRARLPPPAGSRASLSHAPRISCPKPRPANPSPAKDFWISCPKPRPTGFLNGNAHRRAHAQARTPGCRSPTPGSPKPPPPPPHHHHHQHTLSAHP